jgi:hypothetical protein
MTTISAVLTVTSEHPSHGPCGVGPQVRGGLGADPAVAESGGRRGGVGGPMHGRAAAHPRRAGGDMGIERQGGGRKWGVRKLSSERPGGGERRGRRAGGGFARLLTWLYVCAVGGLAVSRWRATPRPRRASSPMAPALTWSVSRCAMMEHAHTSIRMGHGCASSSVLKGSNGMTTVASPRCPMSRVVHCALLTRCGAGRWPASRSWRRSWRHRRRMWNSRCGASRVRYSGLPAPPPASAWARPLIRLGNRLDMFFAIRSVLRRRPA